jgi:hypothetical protein
LNQNAHSESLFVKTLRSFVGLIKHIYHTQNTKNAILLPIRGKHGNEHYNCHYSGPTTIAVFHPEFLSLGDILYYSPLKKLPQQPAADFPADLIAEDIFNVKIWVD